MYKERDTIMSDYEDQKLISSTFRTRSDAEHAVTRLENIGVVEQQISLIAKEETREKLAPKHAETDLEEEGAGGGAVAGGLFGALAGAALSGTALVIPGLNIIVAGALATTLTGLATGAVAGGAIGALVGAGVSPDDAEVYERELNEGAILLTVRPMDDKQRDKIHNVLGETEARHLAA
jgi:uncharacterized membrane protein